MSSLKFVCKQVALVAIMHKFFAARKQISLGVTLHFVQQAIIHIC